MMQNYYVKDMGKNLDRLYSSHFFLILKPKSKHLSITPDPSSMLLQHFVITHQS
ncbi:hypothetical protein Syun_028206 [Stephania yunnanensis]|uniref:Uncharacterized protein n=1 Tax=Stephania yunnanensis TaxID=152371 RepID=A0AAP0EGX7_9MAGN